MNKGDQFEIDIIDITEDGDGVGRLEGLAVFVAGAVPGDKVLATCTEFKKSYAKAKVDQLTTASSARITPPCPIADRCGGCTVMHMDYNSQLKHKEKKVVDALERIGGFKNPPVKPIIGMDDPFRYRNKGLYPIQWQDGKVVIGFYEHSSHKLVPVEDCLIQPIGHKAILAALKVFIAEQRITCYDKAQKKGLLRQLLIRSNENGAYLIGLMVSKSQFAKSEELVKALTATGLNIQSVYLIVQTEGPNGLQTGKVIKIHGEDGLTETIQDIQYGISPLSFFQVNTKQTEILYQKAREYAALKPTENAFDLYSGLGSISLLLAKDAKWVYGNEVLKVAVEDARQNATNNSINNVSFHIGKAETVFPTLVQKGYTATTVVLDPPRKGCDPAVLKTLLTLKPERIVYVSCMPSTLARDLKILCETDYKIEEAQPVDLFPHSMHVETVVFLSQVNPQECSPSL